MQASSSATRAAGQSRKSVRVSAQLAAGRRFAPVKTAASPVMTRRAPVQTLPEEGPAINVDSMYARLEARAKAMIAIEEQEIAARPKVKFTLPFKVGLGESWKIVGKAHELGLFRPEVAPYMKWNAGDVWSLEVPMRPGRFTYKAVLRKPDGTYLWEEGPDRVLEVPYNAITLETMEIKLGPIKFPAF